MRPAIVALALSGFAAATAAADLAAVALLSVGLACVAALLFAKENAAGYSSFAAIFLVFFGLYGVSGPLDDVLGLGGLIPSFVAARRTDAFLLHLALALAGLVGGLLLAWSLAPRPPRAPAAEREGSVDAHALLLAALALAALASAFEIVNFVRVGGVETLRLGKAVYQGRVADLRLTLPSYVVSYVAVAAFSLFVALSRHRAGRLDRRVVVPGAAFAGLLAPLLVPTLMLTRRSEIIAWILIAFVGTMWFHPVRRIGSGLVVLAIGAYLLVPVVRATRSSPPEAGLDIGSERWRQEFVRGLNPAADEFGSPYGNFNEYYVELRDEPLRWGRTYVDGLAVAVPGFLWPGRKPPQIDYEIRDRLYPGYGAGSSIASPGFSSLLEAYINFGTWGVPAVHVVIGLAIGFIERLRAARRVVAAAILYLSVLPMAQTFHRSAFGPAVISVGAMLATVLVIFLALYHLLRRPGRGLRPGRAGHPT
jgi:hypothetical protein